VPPFLDPALACPNWQRSRNTIIGSGIDTVDVSMRKSFGLGGERPRLSIEAALLQRTQSTELGHARRSSVLLHAHPGDSLQCPVQLAHLTYPEQTQEREEIMNLLGAHKAIVLSGHLHKTSVVVRNTPSGNFVQVGLGSVVPSLDALVKQGASMRTTPAW
jgi:hypothetical protein